MKIRLFFSKKDFIDVKCNKFNYINNKFWYLDMNCISHEIPNVLFITSL